MPHILLKVHNLCVHLAKQKEKKMQLISQQEPDVTKKHDQTNPLFITSYSHSLACH